jgi:hypothetical protein
MRYKYVEMRNGGYYVAGSRVSPASIIHEYRDGVAAGTIRQTTGGPVNFGNGRLSSFRRPAGTLSPALAPKLIR